MAVISIHRPSVIRRTSAYAPLHCRWAAFLIDTGLFLFIQSFTVYFMVGCPFPADGSSGLLFPKPDIFLADMGYIGKLLYVNLYFLFIHWLYNAVMESSVKQGTVGKIVLRMKVTDMNGKRINFWQASIRHFAKYLSVGTLLLGLVSAFFSSRKQTLHDLVAGTTVRLKKA
ncbi:RDD family protein [Adhaeribacter soli]|uniref:RDD family protein n=1 Tax=Adhaeribacter soli TaxID=2607655 RepID=A0A5N1IRH8_9BACT|nr:RDD family protein [Adhaeribacter soli]KAA9332607.1 RDD family protein [Adhaeribacter soli]